MTEAELLAHVLEAAAELGVLAFHSGDSRRDLGDPGFPDLVLVGERVELWELKSMSGTVHADQAIWIRRLATTELGRPRVVRPDAWPHEIYGWLRRIRGPGYTAAQSQVEG